MKTLYLALILISAPAFADDNISVTVNGRVYQCNGEGGGNFTYYCKCYVADGFWHSLALGYFKLNRDTGVEVNLRNVLDYGSNSDGAAQVAVCEADLKKNPLCRAQH